MLYYLFSLLLLGCSFAGQSALYVVSLPPLEKRPVIAYLDKDLQSRISYKLYVYSSTGELQKWSIRDSLHLSLKPSSVLLCYPQLISSHDKLEFKPYGAWVIDAQRSKRIMLQWDKGMLALFIRAAQQQGIALYRLHLKRLVATLQHDDAWFFDETKLKEALLNEKLLKRDFKKKPSLTLKNYESALWSNDAYLKSNKDYLQLPTGVHTLYSLDKQEFFKIKVDKKSFYSQKVFIEQALQGTKREFHTLRTDKLDLSAF